MKSKGLKISNVGMMPAIEMSINDLVLVLTYPMVFWARSSLACPTLEGLGGNNE